MYSTVSNKRPGRLLVFGIFAFGTVKTSGTVNFFHPFLAFGTFNKFSFALVRLLGFERCACETSEDSLVRRRPSKMSDSFQ